MQLFNFFFFMLVWFLQIRIQYCIYFFFIFIIFSIKKGDYLVQCYFWAFSFTPVSELEWLEFQGNTEKFQPWKPES